MTAANPQCAPAGCFGRKAAISGEWLLIDSTCYDPAASYVFYLFCRDATGNWTQSDGVAFPPGIIAGPFDGAVAIDGDLAVVGTPNDDNQVGTVYPYHRTDPSNTPADPSDDVWIAEAPLKSNDPGDNELFGFAVSMSGNWLAAADAWESDPSGGAVHMYERIGGAWVWRQRLTAWDRMPRQYFFGNAVAMKGDRLVVGALHYGDCNQCGAAYVFRLSSGTWVQEQRLVACDAAVGDELGGGLGVAIDGDRIVVGSHQDDDGAPDAGSAYVFQWNGTQWVDYTKLTQASPAVDDSFGTFVSINGTLVTVSGGEDNPCGVDSGSVYVFDVSGAPCTPDTPLPCPDCNGNALPDTCDLITGTPDCNANGIPDECDLAIPPGMAVVPAGEYLMGDHFNQGNADELPIHGVYEDAFRIDVFETTNQQYADALNWALTQGGLIEVTGGVVHKAGDPSLAFCDTSTSNPQSRIRWDGTAFGVVGQNLQPTDPENKTHHPMTSVSWYGAAAFANWRSRRNSRTPCYDTSTWLCNFSATGYRLPTEAEWEKAARGGLNNPYRVFPWGDTIDGSKANYFGSGDPWETLLDPRTTPVGFYDGGQVPPGANMANGYGHYDMGGNVWEWCNDWYGAGYYSASPYYDPVGPAQPDAGSHHILRGGAWDWYTISPVYDLRCARRNTSQGPIDERYNNCGFRLVLGAESIDCNSNGIPDECDIADCPPRETSCSDCNGNAVPDVCDLASCFSAEGCNEKSCQFARLTHPDPSFFDNWFGGSVSLDGNTAVVGAWYDDCAAGLDCGGAHVFEFDGTAWGFDASLSPSDAANHDFFGLGVAVSGNLIVVGAPGHRCGTSSNCGAAYLFQRENGTWTQRCMMTAPQPNAEDAFGAYGVAVHGDTIVVGAYLRDGTSGADLGSAYVYRYDGETCQFEHELVPSNVVPGASFGISVALDGNTAVVGAFQENCAAGPECGSAYVFERTGTTWGEAFQLPRADAEAGDRFGYSVCISGNTIAVGAAYDDEGIFNQGVVHVFERASTSWTRVAKLTASDAAMEDGVGNGVSISGDRVAAGAQGDDCVGGGNCGSVYLFRKPAAGWHDMTETEKIEAPNGREFGAAVALSNHTLLASTPFESCAAGGHCGAAYIFDIRTDDCDCNGLPDECDIADCLPGDPACGDCNSNGVPDGCEGDCQSDGIPDPCQILVGTSCDLNNGPDVPGNGVPDECECGDGDPCTWHGFIDGVCVMTPRPYGDVAPPGGDGFVDVGDILCALDCFADYCSCASADIFPNCAPNRICDVGDVLAMLDAFGGIDPCCGG